MTKGGSESSFCNRAGRAGADSLGEKGGFWLMEQTTLIMLQAVAYLWISPVAPKWLLTPRLVATALLRK